MSLEVLLRLSALIPFIYAGLYTLTDPASSIRVVNRVMAQAHEIEAETILGDLFAAPKPFADSARKRVYWRLAGLTTMAAGLTRLYFL
jgi:hypothetical protein